MVRKAETTTGRPTITDVAAEAGVSTSLVSLVMRDLPGASPANRRRVSEAAERLGYRPDSRAQRLRKRQTGTIGVVVNFEHPFHADMIEALYAEIGARYELAISAVTPSRKLEEAVASLINERCDVLLFLGVVATDEELMAFDKELPSIMLHRRLSDGTIDTVRVDDVDGGRIATEHLMSRGHRRVLYIDGAGKAGSDDRLTGFMETVAGRGLAEFATVLSGGESEDDGARAMREVLSLSPDDRPTGIFAYNDRCALGVLYTAVRAGIQVPDELSVVGYDDSRISRLISVGMTTIRQDTKSVARSAVARAVARMQEPALSVADHVLQPTLVVRSTTAAAPNWASKGNNP